MAYRPATALSRVCLLFLCLISVSSVSFSQIIGRQRVDQYSITPWGEKTGGLTWLPEEYDANPGKSYPLIIFLHGAGEAGNNLWGLASTALPQRIASGWSPQAVNPADGQTYKFIVISPQAPAWSYAWGHVQHILADVSTKYRVDRSRVYVTGLSAGGAGTISCYLNGFDAAQKVAAIVPICPAGTNSSTEANNIPLMGGTNGGKVWTISGSNDSWMAFSTQLTQQINSASPAPSVPAILSPIPGAGHDPSAWNTAYDPNWRNNAQGRNIYEWMLQYTRAGGPTPVPSPTPTPVPVPNPVVTPVSLPGRVEAESYSTMSGIETENCSDAGGGRNVGWQDNNDWMDYSVNVSSAGTYTVSFRVASLHGGAQFQLRNSAGTVLTTVTVPNTGSFQSWQTVTAQVSLTSGQQTLRIFTTNASGGWNINWLDFAVATAPPPPPPTPTPTPVAGRIEAENYSGMSGIQTEDCADAGGGRNVGWQDNNDWMDYSVNVTSAGTYNMNFRVASLYGGAQFQLRNNSGAVLATATVPNTGSFQTWQTITVQASLAAGQQTLRIFTTNANGGWNINWFEIGTMTNTPTPTPSPAPGSQRIEAEAYTNMFGVQKEACADDGGGENLGWQDNGDWEDYHVNVGSAATYTLNFRVASMFGGAQFQVRNAAGTVLTTVTVPNTGGFQTWRTISAQVALPAGQQTIRLFTTDASGGWNINWFEIAGGTVVPSPSPLPSPNTQRIEAENYSGMSGIQTEDCADAGGGRNVGWQDNNDWMDYSVNVSSAGTYNMNFRVATMFAGARFQVRNAAGTVLTTVSVPNTGGFQTWHTVTAQVSLPAGQQTLRLLTTDASGGWNINWFEIGTMTSGASVVAQPSNQRIEAERYTNMSGIQKEACSDNGGGENIGWQDNGDWMDYSVNVNEAGTYNIDFRVATMFAGAQFQVRNAAGNVLATVTVPNTGGFQTWQTVSASVALSAGQQTIRVYTSNASGGWNLNWLEVGSSPVATLSSLRTTTIAAAEEAASVQVYPNPIQDRFSVTVDNALTGVMRIDLVNMSTGSVAKSYQLQKTAEGPAQFYLSASEIQSGNYLLRATMTGWTQATQIIKN